MKKSKSSLPKKSSAISKKSGENKDEDLQIKKKKDEIDSPKPKQARKESRKLSSKPKGKKKKNQKQKVQERKLQKDSGESHILIFHTGVHDPRNDGEFNYEDDDDEPSQASYNSFRTDFSKPQARTISRTIASGTMILGLIIVGMNSFLLRLMDDATECTLFNPYDGWCAEKKLAFLALSAGISLGFSQVASSAFLIFKTFVDQSQVIVACHTIYLGSSAFLLATLLLTNEDRETSAKNVFTAAEAILGLNMAVNIAVIGIFVFVF